jgi:hypothetical protein
VPVLWATSFTRWNRACAGKRCGIGVVFPLVAEKIGKFAAELHDLLDEKFPEVQGGKG